CLVTETVCDADLLSSSARHLHSREISREAFGVRQSATGPIRRGEIDAALTFRFAGQNSMPRHSMSSISRRRFVEVRARKRGPPREYPPETSTVPLRSNVAVWLKRPG